MAHTPAQVAAGLVRDARAVFTSAMVFSLLLTSFHGVTALADEGVQDVTIRLELTGGYVGAEAMVQLEEALLDTVELALLDQLRGDLDYIVSHEDVVVQTLGTVIDSALAKRGFALEELVLEPGSTTRIIVRLRLAEERVKDFRVRFVLLSNTPVIESVVQEDEEAVAAQLYATVARTPYGDTRWLSNLVTDTVEQYLDGLPAYRDFEHLVLVQPGPTTEVAVAFTPSEDTAVLSDYVVNIHSLTLLNTSLGAVREQMVFYLKSLVGAPLSFLEAKLPGVRQATYQYVINRCGLGSYRTEADLSLELRGCTLRAMLHLDSQRYMVRLSGRLDAWEHGSGKYGARISAGAGIQPRPGWVVYAAGDYFPTAGEVFPMAGMGHIFGSCGFVGVGWDFQADAWRFQGQHDIAPHFYLSANLVGDGEFDELSEIALHYRIRDVYELQLVSTLDGEVFAAIAATF